MRNFLYTKSALLTAFALCAINSSAMAQAWDGTSAAWTNGDGTENNPYLIETPQQLAYLSEKVNEGETFEGKYFKLANNLDMGGTKEFTCIGTFDSYFDSDKMQTVDNSLYFKGTFNGDNHVIDNLKINYVNEELGGTGLFACSTKETTIRNLIIGNNSTITGGITTGAFIGQMNGGLLENCENRAYVEANMYSGAVVGVMEDGVVRCCSNRGKLYAATEIGGIVGQGAGTGKVEYCYNVGTIEAFGFGGGGIGGALYENFSIANCYNIGAVSGEPNPYLGAPHAVVSDAAKTSTVTNCYYVTDLSKVDDSKATAVSEADIKQTDFLAKINNGTSNFIADEKNINNGFPILSWQNESATGIKETTTATTANISIIGNNVVCDAPASAYTIAGEAISNGTRFTLTPGAYIIKTATTTKKVVIK